MAEVFYVLLGIIMAGYFALAGYDYGVGILLRATARPGTERRLVLGALGPFFLGNEVWLVAGLGLLIGAFPLADGSLLSGLYPVMIPLIAALVVFTAAVQIRSRAAAARPLWDLVIMAGGFVISFGWGAVFGVALQGFPLRFGPLPVLTGALTTALFAMHGATLLVLRTPDPVRGRARQIAIRMTYSAAVLAVVAGLTAVVQGDAIGQPIPAAALTLVLVAAIVAAGRAHRAQRPGWALVATGAAAALPVVVTGIAILPYLYVHADASQSLTVSHAAASSDSLSVLLVTAVPILPVLLAFQAVTWWLWRRAPRQPNFY